MEIVQFVILLALYLFIMEERDPESFSIREIVFIVYTSGWILDQVSSLLSSVSSKLIVDSLLVFLNMVSQHMALSDLSAFKGYEREVQY